MGEKVGIHPEGARALIDAMNKAKDLVTEGFMADVKHQLCVAQSDAVLEAQASYSVYQQYRTFLDTYTVDLKWRIEVITSAPDATIDGEMTYGTTQFDSAKAAKDEGAKDGAEFKKLWEEAQETGDFQPLIDYLEANKDQMSDPAYAEAFLTAVGAENIQDFIDRALPVATGPDPLGPLFTAIATTMNTGRAPEVTAELLKMMDNESISHLIQTQELSDDALFAAANVLLKRSPHLFEKDYLWLIEKLGDRPEVFQRLLADQENAKMLFEGYRLDDDAYNSALVAALDKALAQGAGTPESLSNAWSTIVRLGNDVDFRKVLNDHPEINKSLAANFEAYLAYAGYVSAQQWVEDNGYTMTPEQPDGPVLNCVTDEDLKNFLGGLMQNPDTVASLTAKAQEMLAAGESFGLMNPELVEDGKIDMEKLGEVQDALALEFGIVALLMGGIQVGDLDEDARKQATAKILALPLGSLANAIKSAKHPAAKAVGWALTAAHAAIPYDKAAAWVRERIGDPDQLSPEELEKKMQAEIRVLVVAVLMEQYGLESEEEVEAQLGPLVDTFMMQYDSQTLSAMIEELWGKK